MEDDETPEMIMAKFMELERIQHAGAQARATRVADAAAAAAPGGGQQQQLQQQQQEGQQPSREQQDRQQPADAHQQQQQQQQLDAVASADAAADADDSGGGGAGGLSEAQLLEVFKQTSMFNVRTAMQDNEMLMGIDEILEHTNDRWARGVDCRMVVCGCPCV